MKPALSSLVPQQEKKITSCLIRLAIRTAEDPFRPRKMTRYGPVNDTGIAARDHYNFESLGIFMLVCFGSGYHRRSSRSQFKKLLQGGSSAVHP